MGGSCPDGSAACQRLDPDRRSVRLREVLTFSFEAGLLLQSARQGDVQKRFAGWAAILAVPTAIASIYGMNFNFMPELNVRFGYFAVLAVILAICLYLFYRFRKAGWV